MKKRYILMAVTAALVFAVAAGGTMAANRVETEDIADISTPLTSQTLTISLDGGNKKDDGTLNDLIYEPGRELKADAAGQQGDFEEFKVANTSDITAYVRVTIQKYWLTPANKRLAADNVTWTIGADENWIKQADPFDPDGNGDTVVLYYKTPLATGGQTTGLLDSLEVLADVTGNAYSGATLYVEAVADGVQFAGTDHNDVNRNGIKAAWGVDVTLDENGNITDDIVSWAN